MSQNQPPPTVDSWEVVNLELIAFPASPEEALKNDWWTRLVGSECETTLKRNERKDEGKYSDKPLRVSVDVLRVVWTAFPVMSAENYEAGMPTVGTLQEACDWFVPLMDHWLEEMCPATTRLAFAAKIVQKTSDREESYRRLDHYLNSVTVDPQSTDFQYRINRKRPTTKGVPDLIINRLSTWSAVTFQYEAQLRIQGSTAARTVEGEQNACLLALDINTDPTFKGELPHDRLTAIWRELVDLGFEIARRGDIP